MINALPTTLSTASNSQSDPTVLFFSIFLGIALLMILFQLVMVWPYVSVKLNGGKFTLLDIVVMRLQRLPARMFVDAHLALVHRGIEHTPEDLQKAYLANKPSIQCTNDLIHLIEKQSQTDQSAGTAQS